MIKLNSQFPDSLPESKGEREDLEIAYYQWVPFVLALQGLLIFIPRLFWTMLNSQSGLDIREIIRMGMDDGNLDPEIRKENVAVITSNIYNASSFQKSAGKHGVKPWSWMLKTGNRPKGCFVSILYMFVKVLFIINMICQLFLLRSFIGTDHHLWGSRLLGSLSSGEDWKIHGHFPRTTICDFEVKWLGNVVNYSVQCVLMINMFNEKIYIFLWFWFIAVIVLTIVSLVKWLVAVAPAGSRVAFVSKYVPSRTLTPVKGYEDLDVQIRADPIQMDRFVRSKLRPDGVFVLMLLSMNAGDAITCDVIRLLYAMFIADNRRAAEKHKADDAVISNF